MKVPKDNFEYEEGEYLLKKKKLSVSQKSKGGK
jgi:hypothetical protein